MTRPLAVLPSDHPGRVLHALRDSLTGDGPAVLVRDAATEAGSGLPAPREVARTVALVVETSGSTGTPKRVALSADALLASAAASASALGGQGQWMLALPTHYIAGAQVLVRSLAAGTDPVVLPAGHFDPARFVEYARTMTGDARFVSLVPAQLIRLLDEAGTDDRGLGVLQRFDRILVGGQSLPVPVRKRAAELRLAITTTYGSSETAGGCVYDGVPIGTTIVREIDGQIEIAGPVLAEGYLGDAQRTDAAFHYADGHRWYRTGDLGAVTVDADGTRHVSIHGRADNVIISGGEKVLLDAVERIVRELPGFSHAIVVGVPSAEWGEVPVVVTLRDAGGATDVGGAPDVREVREMVTARLGRAAAPARILEVDSMPMLPSGKPDRVTAAGRASSAQWPPR